MNYRITISPDPTRIINQTQKRNYMSCTTREQYNVIKHSIRHAVQETAGEYQFKYNLVVHVYFELNSSGMLHCHGTLITDKEDKSIGPFFQRMIFRTLGRTFVKGNPATLLKACCDVVDSNLKPWTYTNDPRDEQLYESWEEYCLKEQKEMTARNILPYKYEYLTDDKIRFDQSCREAAEQLDAVEKMFKN